MDEKLTQVIAAYTVAIDQGQEPKEAWDTALHDEGYSAAWILMELLHAAADRIIFLEQVIEGEES